MRKVFLLLLLSLSAHAGQEGHGGGSIVCRNPATQEIISAQLLDIWEGQLASPMGLGLPIPETDNRDAEKIAREKIATFTANNKQLGAFVSIAFENLLKIQYSLPGGIEIADPLDTGNLFIPQGCAVEYAANYKEDARSGDILFLNKTVVDRLNPVNHAALLVHEAIYKVLRDTGSENSIRARLLVGNLFSSKPFPPAKNLSGKQYHCLGQNLWQADMYESNDSFTFDFQILDSNLVLTQKLLVIPKQKISYPSGPVDTFSFSCLTVGFPGNYDESKCVTAIAESYLEGGDELRLTEMVNDRNNLLTFRMNYPFVTGPIAEARYRADTLMCSPLN